MQWNEKASREAPVTVDAICSVTKNLTTGPMTCRRRRVQPDPSVRSQKYGYYLFWRQTNRKCYNSNELCFAHLKIETQEGPNHSTIILSIRRNRHDWKDSSAKTNQFNGVYETWVKEKILNFPQLRMTEKATLHTKFMVILGSDYHISTIVWCHHPIFI